MSWDALKRCGTVTIKNGVQGVASSNPATPTKVSPIESTGYGERRNPFSFPGVPSIAGAAVTELLVQGRGVDGRREADEALPPAGELLQQRFGCIEPTERGLERRAATCQRGPRWASRSAAPH